MKPKLLLPIFLITLFIIPLIPNANAGSPVQSGLRLSLKANCSNTVGSCASSQFSVSTSDLIMVSAFCQTTGANTGLPTDSLGNTYTLLASVGLSPNDQQMFYSFSTTNGGDTVSVPIGGCTSTIGTYTYMYTIESFFGITGIGQTATNQLGPCGGPTCTNSLSIATQPQSIIYESMGFTAGSNNNNCISGITPNSGQLLLQNDCSQRISGSSAYASFWKQLSVANPTMMVTYTSNSASSSNQHILAELLTTTTTQAFVSQCYGECGSPAITLANTNATHSINFNTSVTIFYEFQSNLNGILQNVTVNVGKSYSSGQQVGLGVWTASCPAGTLPFNIQCAGILQSGSLISPFNTPKGKFTINPLTSVTTGEWIAIGVSGVFSGLDLNETNGVCGDGTSGICANGMQFTKGFIPQTISTSSSCATGNNSPCNFGSISSTALWSWIQGNIIVGTTPPPPSTGCINSDLACFLVASACGLTPSNCFIGGAILFFIYFVVFVISITLCISYVNREYEFQIQFPPSLFFVFFLVELFTFGAMNLIPPVVVIVVFLFIALGVAGYFGSAFLGRSKRE